MIGLAIRSCIIFFTSVVLVYLIALPTAYEQPVDETFHAMPDADLAAIAEHHWSTGNRESAITVLEYARETAVTDQQRDNHETGMVKSQPLCRQLLREYTRQLADEASIDGRLYKIGSGAVTGHIDSWESMAGSTVADFFVVGDIRDLVVQGFFVDDSDELIVALSAVGIATTVWPPADPAISMVKAARKSQSISKPITEQLMKAARQYKQAPGPKSQKALIDTLKPIWELGGKCKSWSQFKLMLKHSNNVDQIRMLNKVMAHGPQTARQLNAMFAVCAFGGKQFSRLFSMLNKSGQKGCDALYTVLRKGPPGLRWLAKNPKLVTRAIKIGYKDTKWGYNELLQRYGRNVLVARYAGIILCIMIIVACTPFRRLFRRKRSKDGDTAAKPRWLWRRIGIFGAGAAALTLVLSWMHAPPVTETTAVEPKNDFSRAAINTREIRIHLQEDDDIDPNDHYQHSIVAPLITADDGSQWLICSREDLGMRWSELNDGDISMVSYILSRRGPDPASADTPEQIYFYGPYPRLCLIPCPPVIAADNAQTPLDHEQLQDQRPLFYVDADNSIRGITVTNYSVSRNVFAADIKRSDQRLPRFGDFLLDRDGALAGFFTTHRSLLNINPDFRKQLVHIVRCRIVNNSGYHQQFVEDIQALP